MTEEQFKALMVRMDRVVFSLRFIASLVGWWYVHTLLQTAMK